MKTFHLPAAATLAAIVFASVCVTPAGARCVTTAAQLRAVRTPLLSLQTQPVTPLSPQEASNGPDAPIAGYWYVRFEAGGQLVDDGFDVWLAEGMEILNDTTPPSAGDVCLGVWTKTGPSTYSLKHPSWIFDDTGVNLIGVVIIREVVTVNSKADSFTGTATFNAYDLSGNRIDYGSSSITGARVQAIDNSKGAGGIPGLPPTILNR